MTARAHLVYDPPAMDVRVVRHPLVEDVLAALRDRRTPCDVFRQLARRVSVLLVAEATRDLPLREGTVETPLAATAVSRLAARVVAVPVLREARDLLAPGGKLVVAVPNIDSLPFRWFGRHWFGLDLPRHLTHFTPASLVYENKIRT